jgi:acyl-CoA synthetase (AMP-forming)/AMP-acid ligase II
MSLAFGLTETSTIPTKLTKGDVILIFSPNSLAWPVVLFGAVSAGLICTLANSTYTPNELRHQWENSGAKVAFVHPCLVGVVREMFRLMGYGEEELKRRLVVANTDWLTGIKDEGANPADSSLIHLPALLAQGSLPSEVPFNTKTEAGETVYLCYSSGTTGKPKGVETTHKNMVALVNIVTHAFPKFLIGQDVMLGVLPFYHIFGIAMLLHFPFYSGIPVVIMPRFEPVAYCAHIEKYKITVALVVPPILLAMARHPATTQYDLRSLKMILSGAAPLGTTLVNAVRDKLMSVGVDAAVCQGYGLTETSPAANILFPQDWLRKLGTVGLLLPNLEARLVCDNPTGGKDVVDAKAGEPGELWLRGPTIMKARHDF